MVNRWARAAKISLITLGCLAGIASVLKVLHPFWWLVTLVLVLGSYWLIGHRDPWISLSWLREKAYRIDLAQMSRPSWVGAKAGISLAGPAYFGASLLLLCVSQLDLSTGRVSFVAQVVGTVNLQLLLVLVGTWLLFRACEIARAVQRHVNASGQINN